MAGRKFAENQEGLKPLSREEWDRLQAVEPQSPFEQKWYKLGYQNTGDKAKK